MLCHLQILLTNKYWLSHKKLKQRGFTLIELLISLAILGIISAIAVPSFSESIRKNTIRSHTSEIYHLLVFARSQAVSYNSPVTICPSTDSVHCIRSRDWSNKQLLIFIDRNYDGTRDETEEEVVRIFNTGEEGSRLLWRSFRNKSYLTFMPVGLTDYQSGNITYCHEGLDRTEAKILVMNIAGRPYYGKDSNGDDIAESGSGDNLRCSI